MVSLNRSYVFATFSPRLKSVAFGGAGFHAVTHQGQSVFRYVARRGMEAPEIKFTAFSLAP